MFPFVNAAQRWVPFAVKTACSCTCITGARENGALFVYLHDFYTRTCRRMHTDVGTYEEIETTEVDGRPILAKTWRRLRNGAVARLEAPCYLTAAPVDGVQERVIRPDVHRAVRAHGGRGEN